MHYSFEVLPGRHWFRRNRCLRLFCKVDCDERELAFIRHSDLYDHPIYELPFKTAKETEPGFLHRLLFASLDPDNSLKPRTGSKIATKPEFITIADLVRGATIPLLPYDIPQTEKLIEARLIEFADTMNLAIARLRTPGRSHGA